MNAGLSIYSFEPSMNLDVTGFSIKIKFAFDSLFTVEKGAFSEINSVENDTLKRGPSTDDE